MLSPRAASLVDAALALARDNGPAFVAALKAHDWQTLAYQTLRAELALAAAAGAPGAGLALALLPVAIELARGPTDPASAAMAKAGGGEGGVNIASGA